jgi:hypothetical protein
MVDAVALGRDLLRACKFSLVSVIYHCSKIQVGTKVT